MKRIIPILFACMAINGLFAQGPSFITAWQPAGQPPLSETAAVTTDAAGNIYTVGHFVGTGDFDPGPGEVLLTSNSALFNDVFVTKMDPQGNLLWARRFGGSGHEFASGVVVDSDGKVIICGHYTGIANMNPGPGNFNLTFGGNTDIFINILDADGNFVFARGIGGNNFDEPYSMVIDADDMITIGGRFGGTVNFGPNTLTAPGAQELSDGFILRMDNSGTVQWAKRIGNTGDDHVADLTLDPDGNIIFTGTFVSYQADFDPSTQWATLTPVGLRDAFVCKWTNSGAFLWVIQIGGPENDFGRSVTTDADGNIYTGGSFRSTSDFNMAGMGYALTSAGGDDAYMARYGPDGTFHWARRIGGTGNDEARRMERSAAGHLVTLGSFFGEVDMDPGPGTQLRNAGAGVGMFMVGLNNSGNYVWDYTVNASIGNGLHSADNGDLFAGGRHSGTVDFDPGPDELLLSAGNGHRAWALRMGVCTPVEGPTTEASACDSYAWQGNNYTSSGSYQVVYPSVSGCDSTLTLQLTISQSNASTTNTSACDSYTWNGNTYTASGSYQVVLTNAVGCDSTATLQLNISTVNTALQQTGATLTAAQNNAAYQWVDCNNGFAPFFGQTGQSFTPAQNGNYAVEITFGICTVMSDCVEVLTTGIGESEQAAFRVYPNPAVHQLTLEGAGPLGEVFVLDMQGRLVHSERTAQERIIVDVAAWAPGAYVLRVGSVALRVVKE
ncbi:MAG: SBBP repeat-containing protein [Flavobacteriales bacterium]|nr:SBBP repeat-containing protein [Flavobacteriales bacterium]